MLEPQTEDQVLEANYLRDPQGPSSKGCCKISNGNSCGSGSLVGVRNGRSLILTNAHVAGTRIGHQVRATFPFLNNATVTARIIMAGYSDRVMMDWAVLEVDRLIKNLPHVKLKNETPRGEHYTAGYPRCRGPFYQRLTTKRITHNGTVWRWQPPTIGGQSGSAIHSLDDNLQYGLLTWLWGGDGAGQTARSIWMQYVNRAAVGFARPEGLVEVSEVATECEEGFFAEQNITTLPIWDHLEDPGDDDDVQPAPEFAKHVMKEAEQLHKRAGALAEYARRYTEPTQGGNENEPSDDAPSDDGVSLFGL